MIRSMPFLQSSLRWRKNCRSRKKQNRNQPKHEVPVNHRLMACRDLFCTEFTCILCGVGRNTHILSKISSTYLYISSGTPCLSIPHISVYIQFQIIRAITVLKINAHIYTLLPSSITKSYKTLVASIKIHKSQLLLFIWIADQSLAFL